jgi:methionyl-tRNA formyltransferase
MKRLNIVFMGSPEFAVPSLEALHNSEHNILAVVSNPDKRRGRRGKPEPTIVKKRAQELGLETLDAEDVKSDSFASDLESLQPDLLVVVAFRVLPPHILAIPKMGSINLHASLLPRYRGAAPIHWAVMKGEKETGCTIFFLDEKVDTGNILKQKKAPIGPNETTGELYNKLKVMGASLLAEAVDEIADGTAVSKPQENELATPAPKLFKENTKIDFHNSAQNIHNFVRGLNPFPKAWCLYGDEKMSIYRTEMGPAEKREQPGTLIEIEGELFVQCGDGLIKLLELQLPGTRRLSGRDFLNGYSLELRLK